jgi:hypothetical protein
MLKSWPGRVEVGTGWMLAGTVLVGDAFCPEGTGEGVLSTVTFSVPQADRAMVRVKKNGMSFLSIYGFLNLE